MADLRVEATWISGQAPPRQLTLRQSDMVLMRAMLGLRWAGVAVAVVVYVMSRHDFGRAWLAAAVVVAVGAWTAGITVAMKHQPQLLLGWRPVLIEAGLAGALLAIDGWAIDATRTWDTPTFGALWSFAAPMTAGVIKGPQAGAAVGAAMVGVRLTGAHAPDVATSDLRVFDIFDDYGAHLVPALCLGLLYIMAGLGAAYLADRQRRAEAEVATAHAREEMALGLHDTVLQNLVAIGRRSEDPTAAHLARETERDLRRFLFGPTTTDRRQLEEALADAVREFSRNFDLSPDLVIDTELRPLHADKATAVAGAVAEALANVGKHAAASRVVVYAGPPTDGGGVFVSVKDDGVGFDPDAPSSGRGLDGSIRARMAAVGGRVEIRSRLGQGTEVRLWMS